MHTWIHPSTADLPRRRTAAAELTMPMDLLGPLTEFARRAKPPLTVRGLAQTGGFDDATVELLDRHVLWRFILERSVLAIVACPSFDQSAWYDADLLKRLLGLSTGAWREGRVGSVEELRTLMMRDPGDLMEELEQLREATQEAFSQSNWQATRSRLFVLGRQRDAELFGR